MEDIPKAVMESLMDYDWPSNIRELENAIQRGIVLDHGRRFVLPDLGSLDHHPAGNMPGTTCTLAENERNLILDVLKKTRWRIYGRNGAAGILAMKPTTLYSRMKKLGIQRPPVDP